MKSNSVLFLSLVFVGFSSSLSADETGGGKTNTASTNETQLMSVEPEDTCTWFERWFGLCEVETTEPTE